MINRQLYTMKFQSSRLKKYGYDITINYQQALDNGEIIALSDNQFLRTIRNVVVEKTGDKKRILDRDLLEEFYSELNRLRKKDNTKENLKRVKEIKQSIIDICFIPEYITIVINHEKHYDYLFKNGVKINGVPYYRLSTSAGQGRVSTVTFCSSEILDSVNEILDNGRNKNKKFSPSKFNAYKGLYGSSTKVVTTPRFCVVADYESELTFKVNYVTETEGEQDDNIELKTITKGFNRWDGQGLISPEMAKIWSNDLGLDYIPAEFCIRQSFLKGMLCVFDFHDFCEKENNGDFMVKSIYKDENGDDIWVNLKDIDVIITESQFKLWDSYDSLEQYKENCEKNGLYWGVSLYTDKEIENTLMYNYQFLQVLDVKKEDVPKLCEDFVDWISGVSIDDIWHTLLFLVGSKATKSSIENYLKNSENYWIKSLIVNHDLINDKYIKQKIYDLIKTKIDNGCIGRISVRGNNQTLVSDPYAMMEYLCGKEVKGLLGEREYYSHYWNTKGAEYVVGTRPPLTYRSEVTKLNMVNTEKQRYWYKYMYGGIIVNVHGYETDLWAGSDFDMDFLSTTDNEVILNSIYENEYPVVYNPPKAEKIIFDEEDLYKSDKFTFGSIIGAITNKSTAALALLDEIEKEHGKDSREYEITLNRVKMCTKLQSAQIDKAKIGREVKGIPKTWTDRKYIDSMDVGEDEKDLLKRILLDRHPYFFIHLYDGTKRKYKKYIEEYDLSSKHKFSIGINELLNKENKTDEENDYIKTFYKYMPVIKNDSVMNSVCKYIESVDFKIKNKIKTRDHKDIHLLLMRNAKIVDKNTYNKVHKEYKSFIKESRQLRSLGFKNNPKYDESSANAVASVYENFKERMDNVCSNVYELTDYLIYIFYVEYLSANKDLLWNTYGHVIFENIKNKNNTKIVFPIPDKEGDIKYLHDRFKLEEVDLIDEL